MALSGVGACGISFPCSLIAGVNHIFLFVGSVLVKTLGIKGLFETHLRYYVVS